ncbi:hypothetical protein LTR53_018187, partial [Teratosphaeriaceae sp. CCFEE 6253]
YKDKLMEDVDLPLKMGRVRINSGDDGGEDSLALLDSKSDGSLTLLDSPEDDATLYSDLREAKANLAELEAREPVVAELPGTRMVTELPAESKRLELDAVSTAKIELEDTSRIGHAY